MTATWTAPATITDGDLVDATWLNTNIRDNIEYLAARPMAYAFTGANNTNITSTSTSWVNISSSYSTTVVISTGRARVVFMGGVSSTTSAVLRLTVDGVEYAYGLAKVAGLQQVAVDIVVTGLSVASHTFAIQWIQVTAGTMTLNRDAYSTSFNVLEV